MTTATINEKSSTLSLPATVWIVSLAAFLNRTVGFLALFSAVFYKSIELSASTLPTALFAVGFAGVLGSLAGGWSAVRFGPARVLITGSILNAPLLFSLGFVTASPVMTVSLAALSVAVTQSFAGPAATIVTESAREGGTLTAFACYRTFSNIGTMVVPVSIGIIGTDGFPLLFLLSSLGSLTTAALLLSERPRLTQTAHAVESKDPANASALDTKQPSDTCYRARLWSVVVVFGIGMLIHAISLSAIPLSVQRLDQGDRLYTLLFLINPIVIICLEIPLSFLVAKSRWNYAFGLGILMNGAGLALCGIGSGWAICIIGFVIFSLGEAVFVPLAGASVADIATRSENIRFQGYISAAQALSFATGPGIGAYGVLHNRPLFWLVIALFSLVAGAAAAVSGMKMRRTHVQ